MLAVGWILALRLMPDGKQAGVDAKAAAGSGDSEAPGPG